jgi:hypothetical protein
MKNDELEKLAAKIEGLDPTMHELTLDYDFENPESIDIEALQKRSSLTGANAARH